MQLTKTIASAIFSAAILLACNSNNSTKGSVAGATDNSSASTNSGDDMYYELTTTSSGKDNTINMTTKMFVSSKGKMRSETYIYNSANRDKNLAPIVSIGRSDKPDESIIIDDSAKTYSVNHIDSTDLNSGFKTESTATKIGEEKILGFNCVHAKIISNKKIGGFFNETDTIDLWRSNEVPMQASVKDLMDRFESKTGNSMYSQSAADQLKQMGCEGFMVKLTMKSKNVSTMMQLTKAEHRDLPANMFEIPAGYKEDKSGM